MFCSRHNSGGLIGRLFLACAAALCLALPGCASWNLRGEPFHDNPLANEARRLRAPDKDNELFGVSNKAEQIERDLGVQ